MCYKPGFFQKPGLSKKEISPWKTSPTILSLIALQLEMKIVLSDMSVGQIGNLPDRKMTCFFQAISLYSFKNQHGLII